MTDRLPLADRVMKARTESVCQLCDRPVRVGQHIARCAGTWYHAACVAVARLPPPQNPQNPQKYQEGP